VDGYPIGNISGYIPLSNGILNEGLVAHEISGDDVFQFIVSKASIVLDDLGGVSPDQPITPSFLDVNAIDMGSGVIAEFVNGYKIQPQDGSGIPSLTDKLPLSNNILQKELNAEKLDGYKSTDYALITHDHTLDELTVGSGVKIKNIVREQITSESIADDSISYQQIDKIAYDRTVGMNYTPVFESGEFNLSGFVGKQINFTRNIKDPRIFLNPVLSTSATSGYEKRTAYLKNPTASGFSAIQFGSIVYDGVSGYSDDANDLTVRTYEWWVIGSIN
jgi:hypothetical protein